MILCAERQYCKQCRQQWRRPGSRLQLGRESRARCHPSDPGPPGATWSKSFISETVWLLESLSESYISYLEKFCSKPISLKLLILFFQILKNCTSIASMDTII